MIQLANENMEADIRRMWKIVFEDDDAYVDLYFSRKYKSENTLVYIENGVPVASLQMNPYTFSYYREKVPFYYLIGLCTLPEYRKKGYMSQLIDEAHRVMHERGIPLSVLVPAEETLFHFYEKYGYTQISDKDDKPLQPSLKDILRQNPAIPDAFEVFNSRFQSDDFFVNKDFADFQTIIDELRADSSSDRFNLAAMARIIDLQYLMSLFAKANKDKSFLFKTGEKRFKIVKGLCEETKTQAALFDADMPFLCRLLFGFHTSKLENKYASLFPQKDVAINFMLE